MKKKHAVCHNCGHEWKINIYDVDDRCRFTHMTFGSPKCEKCQSGNVTLHD